MESMLISNNKRSLFIYEKNTFLYIVIAVLVIALAGLGALNVRSWTSLHLSRQKLTSCRKVCRRFLILPLSSAAKPISWMLFILMILPFPALLQHLQLRSGSFRTGRIHRYICSLRFFRSFWHQGQFFFHSGRRNSFSIQRKHFHRQFDSSMDNLLNQVQSLLPTDNGTWSVYVCNLAKIPKVPSMISRCRLPA